jgi:hypothetical protein
LPTKIMEGDLDPCPTWTLADPGNRPPGHLVSAVTHMGNLQLAKFKIGLTNVYIKVQLRVPGAETI